MKYRVVARETWDMIDEVDTFAEANKLMKSYEDDDRAEGIYEEDFYSIIKSDGDEWTEVQ